MTLQDLDAALKTVCPETYELAAPKGSLRFIVWNAYGWQSIAGDDSQQLRCPKIQLDIVSQTYHDALFDGILDKLSELQQTYDVAALSYDPDFAAIRMIVQLTVV